MAKVKNKRNAGLADKVHKKKKAEANKKKLNPFEVHINKEKIKVLGKKSKHDRGLPGVSRAKAIQKRKETLGTEMKLINKTNTFIDRRIGEKNNQLTSEDRMIARFAAERAKQHNKKSIYNLADDEILTHRGQTLEQIEKFDDPRSSDDEDEGKKFGGLDDDFVSDGHFGGGVLSKSDSKDGAKSHKDLIEQLIAESKKRKAEKQKEKEQTLDLTEKLDNEWKDLQPVVFRKQNEEESLIDKLLSKAEKGLDYDKMMRELKFEKRGTPSDGLKSKEKQEEEEKKKLAELERQREERMLPEDEMFASKRVQPSKHRSADDLDDNFELDNEQDFMLAYDKDGKPLVPENVLKDFSVPNAKKKFDDGVSDTSDEDSDEESDDEGDQSGDENENSSNSNDSEDDVQINSNVSKKVNNKIDEEKLNENKHSDESSDNSEEDKTAKNITANVCNNVDSKNIIKQKVNVKEITVSDESSEDINEVRDMNLNKNVNKNITNNKESDSSEGTDSEEVHNNIILTAKDNKSLKRKLDDKKVETKKAKQVEKVNDENDHGDTSSNENDDGDTSSDENDEEGYKIDDYNDLKGTDESDEEIEDSNERIGSFFDFKTEEGDNLKKLLTGKTPSQQSLALQNLIKSYNPSLSENNKELLSRLFAHLLQYIHDLFSNLTDEGEIIKSFLVFDKIVPYLYDLIHINKVSTKKFIVELLKEKHDIYKRNPKKVPDLNTLIFFKLVSILYPTSDFRHPVVTPSLVFMSEILTLSRFRDAYSVSRGMFIVSLIIEYTVLSKRFVPAALNFLRGIFYLCANTSVLNPVQVIPPFRLHKDVKILNLENDCSHMTVENKMAAKDLISEIDDSFKIRCLLTGSIMLKEFFDNYIELEALEAIFVPHIQLLSRVDLELYPKKVSKQVLKVLEYIKQTLEVKTYTLMTREKIKPKALRLYEPDIQDVFTGSKNSKLSKEGAEKARLQGKYKKEMKGALREIRRDKAYIASVKIKQKIHGDNIRKEKVKQIYKDASIQQGEINKLKRMK